MMKDIFERQRAEASGENGYVDMAKLGEAVVAKYEEMQRTVQRAEQSMALISEEFGDAHSHLLDAFEVIPEGIVILDSEDRFVAWNQRFADLYGSKQHLLKVGNRLENVLREGLKLGHYPDAIGREEDWLSERLAAHAKESNDQELQLSDGRWVRIHERRTRSGGSVGVRIDITALKQREESFRLLFDNNPVPMWLVEIPSFRIMAVNDAAISHYGYTREQFVKMTVADLRLPEDRQAFINYMENERGSHGRRTWRHVKADGSIVYANVFSKELIYGGTSARLCAIVDITEMTETERTLSEQRLQLHTAINNMSQGLLMFDRDGKLVLYNKRYLEMYRLPAERMKPGCAMLDVMRLRAEFGTYAGNPEKDAKEILAVVHAGEERIRTSELPDGRCIHVVNRPMLGGGWVTTHEDITERREAQKRIEFLAHHDPLTELPNRSSFNARIKSALELAKNDGTRVALLCIDLDRFKEINDVFGHGVGDTLLWEVSRRFKNAAEGAFVSRLGGDEFCAIVPLALDERAAEIAAENILAATSREFEIDGHLVKSGVSIGIAVYPQDADTIAGLIANADAALYRAKREGRGAIRFFEPEMDRQLRERRSLQHDLSVALENGDLRFHYQPQAKIDGTIVGFEALARWTHTTRGPIPPGVFVPLAEENGLIIKLGEWAIREACREAASWTNPLRISVNLSPAQFQYGDLPRLVHGILLETGLPPQRLELEITEGVLIGDFSRALSILRQLKALGVRIAMDDFGTGYSSLSYLKAFPFDKIKIDRSFVAELTGSAPSLSIIRAVIGLARGLSLPVTAEGVETEEQRVLLARESCDEIQGYLIGRPEPIEHYADVVGCERPAQQRRLIA